MAVEVLGVVQAEAESTVNKPPRVYPEVCQVVALSSLARDNLITVLNGQTIIEVLVCFAKQKL